MNKSLGFDFLNLKKEAFGLDLSDFSLKVAQLGKKGLVSCGEQELEPETISGGMVFEESKLASKIQEVVAKAKGKRIKSRYVNLSLPEEKCFLQVIQLPRLSEEELEKAVFYEAENYIPLPINETSLDFQVITPYVNHLDHTDVLLVAFPRVIVDSYVSAIKKSGLTPLSLEPESLAIARALIKGNVSPFPTLVIDFGNNRTTFIIFSGYSVYFTSSIPVSCQQFTEAISKAMSVSLKEAEDLKRNYGILGGKDPKAVEVFEALVPSMTDLLEQFKSHLHYYKTHAFHEHLEDKERNIQKIIISGGGANLKGIGEFLGKELGILTEIGDPWVNILKGGMSEIPIIPYEESLGYTTALGLALRKTE